MSLPPESTIRRTRADLDGDDFDARIAARMTTRVGHLAGRTVIAHNLTGLFAEQRRDRRRGEVQHGSFGQQAPKLCPGPDFPLCRGHLQPPS